MKRFFADLSITKKLLGSPILNVIALLVLGGVAYAGFAAQISAIDELFNHRFAAYQTCTKLIGDMGSVHRNTYKLLSMVSAGADGKAVQDVIQEQTRNIDGSLRVIEEILKTGSILPEEKKLYEGALTNLKGYREQAAKVFDMVEADYSVALTLMGPVDGKFQDLNKGLMELQILENRLSKDKYVQSQADVRDTLRLFLIVAVLAVLFSLLTSILFTRQISLRIMETIHIIKQVAEGDLTQVAAVRSRDELGQLAESLNTMEAKMGDAVGQSREIAQTLSESASEQAASLEETAASLDEMDSMTRQNAGNTAEANQLLVSVNLAIDKAQKTMGDLADSTRVIADASQRTQGIVKSIDEIAFQTNLLALNAAVEAARAGEAGAGFAVVANEVRNLALRATESARNTSELIENIVTKVKTGATLSQTTQEAFTDVTASAGKLSALMGEIDAASKEQREGISQINKAVAEMNTVTQRNAAAAQELASAMAMFQTQGDGGSEGMPVKERVETSLLAGELQPA